MSYDGWRTVPGSRPLRVVLVGAGAFGRYWADVLNVSSDVQLIAVIARHEERAMSLTTRLGLDGVLTGTDLTAIVERTRPDFVVDATAPAAHHDVTMQAFELGLPVLGEKPLAASMDEANELVRAADDSNLLFMVSQNYRYNRGLESFKVMAGELGRIGIINAEFYRAPRFGGFREEMAHPLLVEMAIHTFDLARLISNGEPVAVYCETHNPPWSWFDGDAAATAQFAMADGARFNYRGCWCAEGASTSWNAEWRVIGEHGTAVWDGESAPAGPAEQAKQRVGAQNPVLEGLHGSLADFVTALRTGRTPMGECHDNIRSVGMVHAAIQSAIEGRRVALAELLDEATLGFCPSQRGSALDRLAETRNDEAYHG